MVHKFSPRFEPTTFLIHDLRTDALDRSATIGRQFQYIFAIHHFNGGMKFAFIKFIFM